MNPVQTIIRRSLRKNGSLLNIFAILDPEMVNYNLKLASTSHSFFLAPNGALDAMLNQGQEKPKNFNQAQQYETSGDIVRIVKIVPAHIYIDAILCTQLMNQPLACTLGNQLHMHTIGAKNLPPDLNWINSHQKEWNQLLSSVPEQDVYFSDQAQESWGRKGIVIEEDCESFVEKWSELFESAANSIYIRGKK